MSASTSHIRLRFFGLDLAAARAYLREGWAEALRWPILRWLRPEERVRVVHADGTESVREGASSRLAADAGGVRFVAVALPDDCVLRRSLHLPPLSDSEIHQAAVLDARAASPFAVDDLAWGYVIDRSDRGRLRVDLALTSRPLIERHLATRSAQTAGSIPEVWADGALPIVITGYGEAARYALERRMRRALIALAAVAAILAITLAVTPTLQLRQQALQAKQKNEEMARAVKPQAQMRDELSKLDDQIRILSAAVKERHDVVALLDEVTRLLPDDATLTRFEVNGGAVRLVGQADNAAQLLQSLSGHAAFRDVRAPSGIARAQSGGKETFTIEFNLAPGSRSP